MESDNKVCESEKTQKIHTMVVRELCDTDSAKMKKQDSRLVSTFRAQQLEENAHKYWDQFYNRNKTNFFKDRHWTSREFHELLGESDETNLCMLEVGCGVGNLLFPLIEEGSDIFIYACDFSPKAVEFVRNHKLYDDQKIKVFHADITTDDFVFNLGPVQVNIVTMVFVLSAIHPDKFLKCLQNIFKITKPGGIILLRDYGINDMAQIRFKPGHKIDENFYMRQDGTRSYFFTIEQLTSLFLRVGFKEGSCCYVESRTVNKKEMINVPRVFVQGKFVKPYS